MTTENAAEIRVGDTFQITVTVTEIREDGRFPYKLMARDGDAAFSDWGSTKLIRAGRRISRALTVGDRVTWGIKTTYWPIRALSPDGTWAWIETDFNFETLRVAELERAP